MGFSPIIILKPYENEALLIFMGIISWVNYVFLALFDKV